ncbi:hypothetical protein EfmAA290_08390 [Enterococcus faecium]|nr:hypothetical protein EfmAA290_08390 [Enterococcus faecium]
MDYNTGKELARVRADGIYRPDVNQAYNTSIDIIILHNLNTNLKNISFHKYGDKIRSGLPF